MTPHWQPKERKEDMAEDIREWVRRTSEPTAELKTLRRLSRHDLTTLMLAVHDADKRGKE
jgi:hypothetical protein